MEKTDNPPTEDKLVNHDLNPHANSRGESDGSNPLWQYVQNLSPEVIEQLSKPHSSDVFGVMERNIIGLLGTLPSDHFDVSITTNREHLGRLLASAIMSGYFLRNAEQRMQFEHSLKGVHSDSEEQSPES